MVEAEMTRGLVTILSSLVASPTISLPRRFWEMNPGGPIGIPGGPLRIPGGQIRIPGGSVKIPGGPRRSLVAQLGFPDGPRRSQVDGGSKFLQVREP